MKYKLRLNNKKYGKTKTNKILKCYLTYFINTIEKQIFDIFSIE